MTHLVPYVEKGNQVGVLEAYLSVELIIDFAKSVSSLVSLITFMIFNDSYGVKKTAYIELVKEI